MRYSNNWKRLISNGGADPKEAGAQRIERQKLSKQANEEMMTKFYPLTVENAQSAIDWQEARIAELTKHLKY